MSDIAVLPAERFGRDFIPAAHLPAGCDEYYLRNQQVGRPADSWRPLRPDEIVTLTTHHNICDRWEDVLVTDPFDPALIRNSEFHGLVRIGRLERVVLEHHDLQASVGITDSVVVACDIGDNCAIRHTRYLAHYILGNHVLLLNVDEMHTTNHAKFGNGIVKDGEDEQVRVWLDLMNEASGRGVMPFDGMTTADAWIWAKFRQDAELQARLGQITQREFDPRRGFYGTVGDECVIKNCGIIKDVKIGPCGYIKGASKIKNVTINSTAAEPTQIGEGCELVNGIIGRGCHVFYGCKAVRFVLCDNAHLKYGARLIHSVLGSNSTVSCCEILHNLVFPGHEQHHNNSFLIAAVVKGQSNVAAGATVGSNHNSRANDGEIEAGRGFWPGLCVSLKHSSRFASFTLIAKGDYPAELNIPLPFALVNDVPSADRLEIMPAYWWMYNLYALARTPSKLRGRDIRKTPGQHIEFDYLAPDTVEEIFIARRLLEVWTAKASLRADGQNPAGRDDDALATMGRELLAGPAERTARLEVLGEGLERSTRKVLILKPRAAWHAYGDMLLHYAVKNLAEYRTEHPDATVPAMSAALAGPRQCDWHNLGGQIVAGPDVHRLLADIKTGQLSDWPAIHAAYDRLWADYPRQKQAHALATLLALTGEDELTTELWRQAVDQAIAIQDYICAQVLRTRQKDYDNPFRQATFADAEEMRAVVGTAEDNSFVRQMRAETEAFRQLLRK